MPPQRSPRIRASPQASPPASPNRGLPATPKPGSRRADAEPSVLAEAEIPAFRHGERSWTIDGKTVQYLDAWSYTEWFNLLGNPAAVVPIGQSPEGLPIGVQIVGRPWEEERVLAVAELLENECGAWRKPPIC